MSRFNTLYRGEALEAAAALEDEPANEQELRVALQNAFQRIARLERQIEERDRHWQKTQSSAPTSSTVISEKP
jgi:hypothetical protein